MIKITKQQWHFVSGLLEDTKWQELDDGSNVVSAWFEKNRLYLEHRAEYFWFIADADVHVLESEEASALKECLFTILEERWEDAEMQDDMSDVLSRDYADDCRKVFEVLNVLMRLEE